MQKEEGGLLKGIRCRRIGVRGNVKQIAKEYARYHK